MTALLYHFTCAHGAAGIRRSRRVKPRWNPFLGVSCSWWTDDPGASREDLGLTSHLLGCDRMQFRFAAAAGPLAVPWLDCGWRMDQRFKRLLEQTGEPERWWVASSDMRVGPA